LNLRILVIAIAVLGAGSSVFAQSPKVLPTLAANAFPIPVPVYLSKAIADAIPQGGRYCDSYVDELLKTFAGLTRSRACEISHSHSPVVAKPGKVTIRGLSESCFLDGGSSSRSIDSPAEPRSWRTSTCPCALCDPKPAARFNFSIAVGQLCCLSAPVASKSADMARASG